MTQEERYQLEEIETIVEIGDKNLERAHDWIKMADQKAGFTLTITLALLGTSFTALRAATTTIIESINQGRGYWILVAVLVVTFVLYTAAAGHVIWFLIAVVKPRTNPITKHESPLFFGTISKMELETFKATMCSIDCESVLNELSDQTYIAAEIATVKYDYLDRAFDKIILAIVAGLLFVLITHISNAIIVP